MENFRNAFEIVDEIFVDLAPEEKVEYDFYNILGDFSIALVEYRIANNLNQKQLSEMLGLSNYMIRRYESGDCNLTIKRLNEICSKLGITLEVKFNQPQNDNQ